MSDTRYVTDYCNMIRASPERWKAKVFAKAAGVSARTGEGEGSTPARAVAAAKRDADKKIKAALKKKG